MNSLNVTPTIQLLNNNNVLRVTHFGTITGNSIVAVKRRMIDDPTGPLCAAMVMIVDFSQTDQIDLSTEDIMNDVSLSHEAALLNPELVVIGIMPHSLQFGLSRMWQAFAEYPKPLPWSSHIVQTDEEASRIVEAVLQSNCA